MSKKRKFLPAKRDILFKAMFGDEKNTRLLKGLLSAILKLDEAEFETLVIVDPQIKGHPEDKGCIFDVRVNTTTGKTLDVEVQLEQVEAMRERIAFYNAKMFSSQIVRGQDYTQLERAISIIITDFTWIDCPECINEFSLYNPKNNCLFTDIISIYTLELPKIPDSYDDLVYDWLRLINASNEDELEPIKLKAPILKEAVDMLLELNEDEQIRLHEEAVEKLRRDAVARENFVRDQGRAVGRREGIQEGEARGRRALLETARNLMKLGLPAKDIQKATGLSQDEINSLRITT